MMAGRNSQAVGGRVWASQAKVSMNIETELGWWFNRGCKLSHNKTRAAKYIVL
jgi:hypothetical protein